MRTNKGSCDVKGQRRGSPGNKVEGKRWRRETKRESTQRQSYLEKKTRASLGIRERRKLQKRREKFPPDKRKRRGGEKRRSKERKEEGTPRPSLNFQYLKKGKDGEGLRKKPGVKLSRPVSHKKVNTFY